MSWLVWYEETGEIREEVDIADVVVGYADTAEEALAFAEAHDMPIAV